MKKVFGTDGDAHGEDGVVVDNTFRTYGGVQPHFIFEGLQRSTLRIIHRPLEHG